MMIRTLIFLTACLFVTVSSASLPTLKMCPPASAVDSTDFCTSFKMAAQCYCTSSGLPQGMCLNMQQLYQRMVVTFGSIQKACEFQRHTSKDACVDDWNCYLTGYHGNNEPCNPSGVACS